jgi:hypothetical protein
MAPAAQFIMLRPEAPSSIVAPPLLVSLLMWP